MFLALIAAAALAATPAGAGETEVEAPGPLAPLKGTLRTPAGPAQAVVVIIPGSGPTDRDGNNPLGVAAAPYRLIAEGLSARGIATVRMDKRGLGGSRAAVADGNAVTIDDYATDVSHWVNLARKRTGLRCAWVLGHSEGGLVALVASQQPEGICGVILVSSMSRTFGTVLRDQLKASPVYAALLPQALPAIDALESGKRVDVAGLDPRLLPLFAPQVQNYLIAIMRQDPAKLAAKVARPMLIVQGDRDLQVGLGDAKALAAADPRAKLVVVPGANHVLKAVASEDRAENLATYSNPSLPLAPGIVEAIAGFVVPPRR